MDMEYEVKKTVEWLNTIRDKLNTAFPGKQYAVDAVILGLMTGEPVLLVGDPGTGKTYLVELFGRLLGLPREKIFYRLLSRFTEPDELLGVIDIEAYQRGEYKRIIRNMLPDASIVFLDEIFKAGSAIRNMLLDIILNKRINLGYDIIRTKFVALYTASNEISEDEEDRAFVDRLTIRVYVPSAVELGLYKELEHGIAYADKEINEIMNKYNLCKILNVEPGSQACIEKVYDVVMKIQEETKKRELQFISEEGLPEEVAEYYRYLKMFLHRVLDALRRRNRFISDRRFRKLIRVASGLSILSGSPYITVFDLIRAIKLVLPENPLSRSPDDPHSVEFLSRVVEDVKTYFMVAKKETPIYMDFELYDKAVKTLTALRDGVSSVGSSNILTSIPTSVVDLKNRIDRIKDMLSGGKVDVKALEYEIKELEEQYDRLVSKFENMLSGEDPMFMKNERLKSIFDYVLSEYADLIISIYQGIREIGNETDTLKSIVNALKHATKAIPAEEIKKLLGATNK